jgi:hypothetical protein
VRSLREPVTLAVSADDPEMSYTFMIVPLRNGHFRAEKVEKGDQATSYVSATFRSKREALEWIERQTRVPRELRIDYIVTPTDSGTHCVTLVRTDRETPKCLASSRQSKMRTSLSGAGASWTLDHHTAAIGRQAPARPLADQNRHCIRKWPRSVSWLNRASMTIHRSAAAWVSNPAVVSGKPFLSTTSTSNPSRFGLWMIV